MQPHMQSISIIAAPRTNKWVAPIGQSDLTLNGEPVETKVSPSPRFGERGPGGEERAAVSSTNTVTRQQLLYASSIFAAAPQRQVAGMSILPDGKSSCNIATSHPSHRSLPHKVTCIMDGFFFCDFGGAWELTADDTDDRRLNPQSIICENLRHLQFPTTCHASTSISHSRPPNTTMGLQRMGMPVNWDQHPVEVKLMSISGLVPNQIV